MSVKNELLKLLEQQRGETLSGQQMAQTLSVSRAAVWKGIQALKGDGHRITACTNQGYTLVENSDVLSFEGITMLLPTVLQGLPIEVCSTVDSTNSQAKQRAFSGAAHGYALLADRQISGRGRLGRSFYSPSGSGLYMSVVLHPNSSLAKVGLITVAAALAVCHSIEALTGAKPSIKWVNDLYLNDKKICGILTEAVSDFESGMVESIIVGIGINLTTPTQGIPDEIADVFGVLDANGLSRNQLAAKILEFLLKYASALEDPTLLEGYRQRSYLLGRSVMWQKDGLLYQGTATDIDEKGCLVVLDGTGQQHTLYSGEVSLLKGTILCATKHKE